jgi:hypothetical protein
LSRRLVMKKWIVLLLTITISLGLMGFSNISKAGAEDVNNEELLDEYSSYEETVTLTKEDIENLKLKGKKSLNLQAYKDGNKKYINLDDIDLDLEHPSAVKAMKEAEKAGHDWELGSVTITTKFKKGNGQLLTNKEYKQIIDERKKYGKEKSYKIIKSDVEEDLFHTATLNLGDSGSYVYKFVTSYAYVYNEDSGIQRRHFVIGRHDWTGKTWSWGAVNTHDYDSSADLLVGAWSIGPISSSAARNVSVTYENLSGSKKYYTQSNLTQVVDPNSPGHMSAWKVQERLTGDYAIKKAEVNNYTGWYDRAKVAENGTFRTVYAHGFKGETLSLTVGVSYPAGVSIGITPGTVDKVEKAVTYALMKRN